MSSNDTLLFRRLGVAAAIFHLFNRPTLPQTSTQRRAHLVAAWNVWADLDATWLDSLCVPVLST